MKKRPYYLQLGAMCMLSASLLGMGACSSDDTPPDVPTPPEPGQTVDYTLRWKENATTSFVGVTGGKEKSLSGGVTGEKQYFGNRVALSLPVELHFTKDSLSVVKQGGVTEKYALKWNGYELQLHDPTTDAWEYCGEKDADGKFYLNTVLYKTMQTTEQRTLTTFGQAYSLKDYKELPEVGNGADLVWLRMKSTFE